MEGPLSKLVPTKGLRSLDWHQQPGAFANRTDCIKTIDVLDIMFTKGLASLPTDEKTVKTARPLGLAVLRGGRQPPSVLQTAFHPFEHDAVNQVADRDNQQHHGDHRTHIVQIA